LASSRITAAREALERRLEPVLATRYGRALRRALDAGLLDGAASLSYYLILSLLPCVTLVMGIIGLVGKDPETANTIIDVIENGGSAEAAETLRGGIKQALESSSRSGTALGIGVLGTLYVASLYVAAFSRAAAGIGGGSRRSKLRAKPFQVLVTFSGVIVLALALFLLVISKRIAEALADATGVVLFSEDLWPVAKWAGVVLCLLAIVVGLYSLDPTRERHGLPRPTRGSVIAVALWLAVTIGFEVYLRTLATYDQTYGGALGGVITFLVWAWLTNMSLLYGLAFDQEGRVGAPRPRSAE
jgi:membrane protein